MKLLNRTKKAEEETTAVEQTKARRGLFGRKKVVKKVGKITVPTPAPSAPVEEEPAMEKPVEEKTVEGNTVEEKNLIEQKPSSPKAMDPPQQKDTPIDVEDEAEAREGEDEEKLDTVAEDADQAEEEPISDEEAAEEDEGREQPEAPTTPMNVQTGFLCGCI